ncbi:MAG TPA: dihydrodipicolinate reductase C-terminal domain-containing protein [Pyrinomonadaceae bacterium]|jgi:4-hydroxy-tetrahydrodipicolinate reductase|nr:dihydrodipicolinate reductase C-terminal domain-containing protein [Pyrinomonadaceae bacterium]
MKIALIGFGVMGQLVAGQARKAGDEVGVVFTSKESVLAEKLQGHDVVVDFSVGEAVLKNIEMCARAKVPLVEGTTGWKQHESAAKQIIEEHSGAMVYGANFSIGVNVFYRIVKHASALFAAVDGYAPFIEEAHHNRKRDAPSGTALKLRDLMSEHLGPDIPTSSTRAGYIPGTHRVGFDSEADQVLLTHTARSRQGFASGALLAAHWIVGRTGVFEFGEVMEEILNRRSP